MNIAETTAIAVEVEYRQDSVQAELQILADKISSLDGTLAELGRRTNPVRLSSSSIAPSDKDTPEREKSPIARQIASQSRMIQILIDCTENIICELTI